MSGDETGLRITIRDLSAWREGSVFAAFAAALCLGIAAGLWDLVALAVFSYSFAVANVVRRVHWRGQPITRVLDGPSISTGGLHALPRDVVALGIIAVGFPVTTVVLLMLDGSAIGWIGLGVAIPASAVSAALVGVELRRRHREHRERADD